MTQIVFIHGGDSFLSYDDYLAELKTTELKYERLLPAHRWADTLADAFPSADILKPSMPNKQNAQYDEWKLWFEKIIPFFGDDVRLVGHSLGAMFLAKYLHEAPLQTPVTQLHLVAAGYNEDGAEGYGGFAITSAHGLEQSAESIHLYHSEDDFVVPYSELDRFVADLPNAVVHRFSNRNHFLDADFPELFAELKK